MEQAKRDSSHMVAIPPIDIEAPGNTETATFALGWFWGPDAQFGSIDGVIRTRVGYAGGTTREPTYYNLGDHTETIQMDYDPARITYSELLDVFWRSHNPARRPWSRQYKAAVFYHDEKQKRLAMERRESIAARTDGKVHTEIIAYSDFYLAEPYHQKYQLQLNRNLMREFEAIYSANEDFVNSTAAARVNGYLGGHGSLFQLQAELSGLGLSAAGAENLLHIVRTSR